jgi:hypothetical protein
MRVTAKPQTHARMTHMTHMTHFPEGSREGHSGNAGGLLAAIHPAGEWQSAAPARNDVNTRHPQSTRGRPYGFTVSTTALLSTSVAVILGFVTEVTAFVVTVKVAVLAPGAIVTPAGTTAALWLLES